MQTEWSAFVDLDLRDIGGPDELIWGYRARDWTVERLKTRFEEAQ
jgi:hypothetical protein